MTAAFFNRVDAAQACYDYGCQNCFDEFNNRIFSISMSKCPDNTYYCQKVVTSSDSKQNISKSCALSCSEQTKVVDNVQISTYCCSTTFCNAAVRSSLNYSNIFILSIYFLTFSFLFLLF